MKIAFSLLVVLFFASSVADAARPNVLFVSIDDLNDWIGCLNGHPQTRTPNIDRLAKRGILFANAHCASPACNPSRAAIYSGMRPHRTGVWSNDSHKLPAGRPKIELLPTTFAKAGYATLGTGKLLHGGAKSAKPVFERGYFPEQRWSPFTRGEVDYRKEELSSKHTDSPRHVVKRDGREFETLPLNRMPSDRKKPTDKGGESFDWGPLDIADSEMGDTKISDWSIERLGEEFDKPFFLGVGYYRPHIPLFAPKKYFEPFADVSLPPTSQGDLEDLSPIGRQWATEAVTAGTHSTVVRFDQWTNAVRGYLACVHYVDHEVGRLLKALDTSKYGEQTWIMLWSDHGWHLGEKQHWGKWTGWERSTRVPLIVVPPKSIASQFAVGSTCERPVNLIDLFPTLVEVCGLVAPHELDGASLVPLLKSPESQADRASVTEFDKGNVSVRLQDYRYIRYADGSEEFYDSVLDPNEWNNLAGRTLDNATAERKKEVAMKSARSIADSMLLRSSTLNAQ